jgi:hypothetical protein
MKITLETDFGTFSAEVVGEVANIHVMLGGLVVPVLRAASYTEGTIESIFDMDTLTDALVDFTDRGNN